MNVASKENAKTNIVHISTGLEDGGAEAALFRLCTANASTDPSARQTVISLGGPGKYGPLLEAAGVKVFCLNLKGVSLPVGLARLVTILRHERPDVVQTWMYHANLVGGLAARISGVSNVAWGIHHSRLDPGSSKRSTRGVDWLCARLSPWIPRAIISCSARAAADHIALGYEKAKVIVIANGYNVLEFAPDPAARLTRRRELGIAKEDFLIGAVGRWNPAKDHANLLQAFAELSEGNSPLKLALVGTGLDERNRDLLALIESAKLTGRVVLLGRCDDIPRLMNAFDLHVLSSSSEAFPNVVAEAMACGTPCVVTDVGDAAEIVRTTGWVVPPRDSRALARAIGQAMSEQPDAEAWSVRQAAARTRVVETFSVASMLADYKATWKSA